MLKRTKLFHADPVAALSFVGERKKSEPGRFPRHFWRVKPTGDYSTDCETGTRLGLEYLAHQEADNLATLACIVEDMPRKLTGIESGFLSIVSHAAGAGAYRAREIAAYWERCKAEDAAQETAKAARIAARKSKRKAA